MKNILVIGACDKTDLLLYISRIVRETGSKVLLVDATISQRYKYSVPHIDSNSSLIEYDGFDIAAQCFNWKDLKELCKKEKEDLERYDYIIIDTDHPNSVVWEDVDSHVLVSDFDSFTIQKNKELLDEFFKDKKLSEKTSFYKVIYELNCIVDEDYIESTLQHCPIVWGGDTCYIPFDEEDIAIKIENQFNSKLKIKKLSRAYKRCLVSLTTQLLELEVKEIKVALKRIERGK